MTRSRVRPSADERDINELILRSRHLRVVAEGLRLAAAETVEKSRALCRRARVARARADRDPIPSQSSLR